MGFIYKAAFSILILAGMVILCNAHPIPTPQLGVGLGLEIDGVGELLSGSVQDVDNLLAQLGLRKL